MALILYIESATGICSVALAKNGLLIAEKKSSEPRSHAQVLTIFIEQLLSESGYSFKQLDAICLSKGPGSYTGLRIGAAVAKGLCYALEKPLIAINTLFAMVVNVIHDQSKQLINYQGYLYCPMIDARRMEVYTAVYDQNLLEVSETKALILTETSFMEYQGKKLFFFGDGAAKIKSIINPSLTVEIIADFQNSAKGMITEGDRLFQLNQFENIAYFEPYYLKEFIGKKL